MKLALLLILGLLAPLFSQENYPHRLVVSGFNTTNFGYNWHDHRIDLTLAGTASVLHKSSRNYRASLHGAYYWQLPNGVDALAGVALQTVIAERSSYTDFTATPSVEGGVERLFGRFLLGGFVGFNLFELQKSYGSEWESSWKEQQRFDLTTRFVVGLGIGHAKSQTESR